MKIGIWEGTCIHVLLRSLTSNITRFLDSNMGHIFLYNCGSVLGGITIICGLYVLLWGKAKEMKTKVQLPKTSSGDMSKPLDIGLTPSQENHEIGVYGENSASVVEANADEQPDEIRIVRK